MIKSDTPWPPLMAIWSSPVLIVLQTMAPHVAELFAPGSMPSVFREKYGDITSPWLFIHRDGVRIVTPHTMKPSRRFEHVPPRGGVDASLT